MEVKFNIVKLESGVAIFNYDELKGFLTEKLDEYKNYAVTSENLKDAKKDRAYLNNLTKAIDSKRIEVKKEIMKAYDDVFEPQCKELTTLIKDASKTIDVQIKAIEDAEKERIRLLAEENLRRKEGSIVTLWKAVGYEWVKLETIKDVRWLGENMTEDEIKSEMEKKVDTIKLEVETLKNIDASLPARYLLNLNMAATLAEYQAEQRIAARMATLSPTVVPEPPKEVYVPKEVVASKKVSGESIFTISVPTGSVEFIKLKGWLKMYNYEFVIDTEKVEEDW